MNHLEQLVAEWYEYRGYFVRRNVRVGKLAKGGYECELDVVAFHPEARALVHIEPSLDADPWARREDRFGKKFQAGQKHIPSLFRGINLPSRIDQIALFLYASKRNRDEVGGGRIVLVSELMREIFAELTPLDIASAAVPENYPVLRSFQLVSKHRAVLNQLWNEDREP